LVLVGLGESRGAFTFGRENGDEHTGSTGNDEDTFFVRQVDFVVVVAVSVDGRHVPHHPGDFGGNEIWPNLGNPKAEPIDGMSADC